MSIFRLLLVIAVAAGGYHYWRQSSQSQSVAEATTRNGFVGLPPVEGQSPTAVLVVAAEDCPHEDAQRADRLAEELSRNGIAVVRTHNVSFSLDGPDSGALERINSVMNGPLPIVFVRGRAKGNPSLSEVLQEVNDASQQSSET